MENKNKIIIGVIVFIILASFGTAKVKDTIFEVDSGNYLNGSGLTAEKVNHLIYVQESNFSDLQSKVLKANQYDHIIIPKGTYLANTMIQSGGKNWSILINTSDITIECKQGARIIKASNKAVHAVIGSPSTTHTGVTIKNCYIDANYSQATYSGFDTSEYKGAGINQYADEWKLIDNTIINAGEYGAIVWHGGHGKISGNTLKDSMNWSAARDKYASCLMVTYQTAIENVIENNICLNPAGNGLFFEDNADRNTVVNWISVGAGKRGFSCEHAKDNIVTNLISNNSGEIGIHFNSCGGSMFSNFKSLNSGTDGIYALDSIVANESQNMQIINGEIRNSGEIGFRCQGIENITFSGLKSYDNTDEDIKLTSCLDYISEMNEAINISAVTSTRKAASDGTMQQYVSVVNEKDAVSGIHIVQNGETDGNTAGIYLSNTNNDWVGLWVYSNVGASMDQELVRIHLDNSLSDQPLARLINDGASYLFDLYNNGNNNMINGVDTGTGTMVNLSKTGVGNMIKLDHNNQGTMLDLDQDRPGHGSSQDWNTAQIVRSNIGSSTGTTTGAVLYIENQFSKTDTHTDNTNGLEILMDEQGTGSGVHITQPNSVGTAIEWTNGTIVAEGNIGITNSTGFWLCIDINCTASCQVNIVDGIIVGCS
jgi:hypothetical protein